MKEKWSVNEAFNLNRCFGRKKISAQNYSRYITQTKVVVKEEEEELRK